MDYCREFRIFNHERFYRVSPRLYQPVYELLRSSYPSRYQVIVTVDHKYHYAYRSVVYVFDMQAADLLLTNEERTRFVLKPFGSPRVVQNRVSGGQPSLTEAVGKATRILNDKSPHWKDFQRGAANPVTGEYDDDGFLRVEVVKPVSMADLGMYSLPIKGHPQAELIRLFADAES